MTKTKTPEVRIEPLEMKHAPLMQRYESDPDIAATTLVPHPYPENGGEMRVRWAIRLRAEGSGFSYAVYDEETFVGRCSVGVHEERPELYYWVAKPFWGQGYGTAAAFAVLKRVFSEQGYPVIFSSSYTHNPGSMRILEKCGFQPNGTKEEKRGTLALYILKRDDFNRIVQAREKSGDEK